MDLEPEILDLRFQISYQHLLCVLCASVVTINHDPSPWRNM